MPYILPYTYDITLLDSPYVCILLTLWIFDYQQFDKKYIWGLFFYSHLKGDLYLKYMGISNNDNYCHIIHSDESYINKNDCRNSDPIFDINNNQNP